MNGEPHERYKVTAVTTGLACAMNLVLVLVIAFYAGPKLDEGAAQLAGVAAESRRNFEAIQTNHGMILTVRADMAEVRRDLDKAQRSLKDTYVASKRINELYEKAIREQEKRAKEREKDKGKGGGK